jgi:DmsE family decaheme c-type cytochrome
MKTKNSFKLTGYIFSAVIGIFLTGTIAFSQEAPPEGTEEGCITADCHATMDKDAFLHKPLAEGKCSECHGQSPKHKEKPETFKFGDILEPDKLCFSCHEQFDIKKFTHNPVEEGECTACHSPHGSPYKFHLLEFGGELCFTCHDEEIISNKFVHGPADAGGCIACHDPHVADYEKNLKEKSPELCFACHTDNEVEFTEAKIIHKPVAESCTNCHNPHSAPKQFMLNQEAPKLCFSCHKKKKEWVKNVSTQHGALVTGKACLNCHEPHASNIAKRLSMAPLDLCMSCHDKELRTPGGTTLANMKRLLTENKDHHGPIRQKDCSGCHNPHGSDEFRLLRAEYPSEFYMPFNIENYNLCFKCHEKTIVQDSETDTLTNFRNGKDNLHFKHINKRDKGRTCRACHETHASNYPKHIRSSVPFGNWEFDMNYTKTETGGSCAPGCHKLRKYDRVAQVENQ